MWLGILPQEINSAEGRLNATWTPEFEAVWRVRLEKMGNQCRPFVNKVTELEIHEAFILALNEIERLRNRYEPRQIDNSNHALDDVPAYLWI